MALTQKGCCSASVCWEWPELPACKVVGHHASRLWRRWLYTDHGLAASTAHLTSATSISHAAPLQVILVILMCAGYSEHMISAQAVGAYPGRPIHLICCSAPQCADEPQRDRAAEQEVVSPYPWLGHIVLLLKPSYGPHTVYTGHASCVPCVEAWLRAACKWC